jgi:hypothetical protein
MKVTEMLSLLSAFDEVYASSHLTNPEKAVIGSEVLLRLPHVGLFTASDDTLKAVVRSISDRVAQLEETVGRNGATQGTVQGTTQGTQEAKRTETASKASTKGQTGRGVLRSAAKDA